MPLSHETATKDREAIDAAIASTQSANCYFVKKTQGFDDTIRYLARMTAMLKSRHEVRLPSLPSFAGSHSSAVHLLRPRITIHHPEHNPNPLPLAPILQPSLDSPTHCSPHYSIQHNLHFLRLSLLQIQVLDLRDIFLKC